MRLPLIITCVLCLTLFACKEKQNSASTEEKTTPVVPLKVEDTSQSYFSIRDYLNEQWNLKKENPYTLLKVVVVDGKKDSSFVPFDSATWFTMTAPFYAADISDKKYLGWYRFDNFRDEEAEEVHLHYEAISPDSTMQKMDIAANQYSGMVNLVYMETRQKSNDVSISRKMQYRRDDIIQIIEFEKAAGKPAVNRRIEYKFKY